MLSVFCNLFLSVNSISNKESPDYATIASSARSDSKTALFSNEEMIGYNRMEYFQLESTNDLEIRTEEATIALTIPAAARSFKLGFPLEILFRITEFVADSYERDGIRILQVVLADLLNAALSCPDFLAALPHAHRYLNSKIRMQWPTDLTHDWDELIRTPDAFNVAELQGALQSLNIKTKKKTRVPGKLFELRQTH